MNTAGYPRNLADIYDIYAGLYKRAGDEPVFPKKQLPDWRRANPTPPKPPRPPVGMPPHIAAAIETYAPKLGESVQGLKSLYTATGTWDRYQNESAKRFRLPDRNEMAAYTYMTRHKNNDLPDSARGAGNIIYNYHALADEASRIEESANKRMNSMADRLPPIPPAQAIRGLRRARAISASQGLTPDINYSPKRKSFYNRLPRLETYYPYSSSNTFNPAKPGFIDINPTTNLLELPHELIHAQQATDAYNLGGDTAILVDNDAYNYGRRSKPYTITAGFARTDGFKNLVDQTQTRWIERAKRLEGDDDWRQRIIAGLQQPKTRRFIASSLADQLIANDPDEDYNYMRFKELSATTQGRANSIPSNQYPLHYNPEAAADALHNVIIPENNELPPVYWRDYLAKNFGSSRALNILDALAPNLLAQYQPQDDDQNRPPPRLADRLANYVYSNKDWLTDNYDAIEQAFPYFAKTSPGLMARYFQLYDDDPANNYRYLADSTGLSDAEAKQLYDGFQQKLTAAILHANKNLHTLDRVIPGFEDTPFGKAVLHNLNRLSPAEQRQVIAEELSRGLVGYPQMDPERDIRGNPVDEPAQLSRPPEYDEFMRQAYRTYNDRREAIRNLLMNSAGVRTIF